MLQLCVISWVTQEQLQLLDMLPLELEVVHPGITMCIVQGQSVTWQNVASTTPTLEVPAPTHEMQEQCVPVSAVVQ